MDPPTTSGMIERASPTRRQVLGAGALLGIGALAGCSGGGGDGGGDGDGGRDDDTGGTENGNGNENGNDNDGGGGSDESYEAWLEGVPNYDGSVADRTGEDTVTVVVGAGNGLLFEPPAVRVSLGTTVVWEWTGGGGQHNVKATDGSFESELASAEGTTFERTFEESGVLRYLCVPHEAVGMKGVVEVVDG
jgi:halocyanin-like protein